MVGEEDGFSTTQACKLAGVTYRQVDYWARTNLLRPSVREAGGSGRPRRYSYRDLVQLKVIRWLLDAGIGLRQIRKTVQFLDGHLGEDLVSASLVLNGGQSLLVHHEGELIDVLRQGQGVLSVVALGGLSKELDGAITTLRATREGQAPGLVDRATA